MRKMNYMRRGNTVGETFSNQNYGYHKIAAYALSQKMRNIMEQAARTTFVCIY